MNVYVALVRQMPKRVFKLVVAEDIAAAERASGGIVMILREDLEFRNGQILPKSGP